jgi:hypothetical protein
VQHFVGFRIFQEDFVWIWWRWRSIIDLRDFVTITFQDGYPEPVLIEIRFLDDRTYRVPAYGEHIRPDADGCRIYTWNFIRGFRALRLD